jgi:hypothetical protein
MPTWRSLDAHGSDGTQESGTHSAVSLKPSLITQVVGLCVARAWMVVTAVAVICVALTHYVTSHFAMTTDTYALWSPS